MARKCEARLTARPWVVRRDPEAWPNSERPNPADHCQILFGDDGDGGDTAIARFADYASDADARLCVAAPELLAACDFVREMVRERSASVGSVVMTTLSHNDRILVLEALEAAIAKARGEARP